MMARMGDESLTAAEPDDDARHRQLLSGPAGALYRACVDAGSLEGADARLQPGHPDHEAFVTLRTLGLVRRDEEGSWLPVDPTAVQSGVVAPLGRQAADLLARGSAWAETFERLSQSYRATPVPSEGLTQLLGIETINRFLEAAVEDAQRELLTAHPAGARRATVQQAAFRRDRHALQRGVRIRTLYQHTARHSRSMLEYVETMRGLGAQIRTLDEFFNRLIVIDRRVAVIPGDGPESAVLIEDPRVVAYLVDIFERTWERARDYDRETRTSASDIATEVRSLTIRMLTEGHSDSASAKRVGVSTRTYASYVAALKEEYGVQTRFQLGLAMGRDGDESTPESVADSAP